MTREDLIKKVIVKIEEVSPFEHDEDLLAISYTPDSNVKPIRAYIDKTLDEACNDVLSIVPLHLIKPTDFLKDAQVEDGYVRLPKDFLRLYAIRFAEWEREVNIPIVPTNPLYKLQWNKYTQGKPTKPVCALNTNERGEKVLEYWSVRTSTTLVKAQYVARFNDMFIQSDLADLYATMTAIKVLDILGDTNGSKVLTQEFENTVKSKIL